MSDRFHRAARDGLLDVLKEGTRRDCNAHDEDGMTPTIWAAHEGRLEALRLLVGRGGDPDKCDHYGNTALHCAAARGQMTCTTFLVNFGVNLWSLDNDFHTPKDLAALNNKDDILRFLDSAAAEQEMANPKDVKQKKEKATKDAEKRIKDFAKIQKKATKRAEKEEKKMQKEREKMRIDDSPAGATNGLPSSVSSDSLQSAAGQQEKSSGLSGKLMATISKNSLAGFVHANKQETRRGSLKYSDIVSTSPKATTKTKSGGVKGRIQQKQITTAGAAGPLSDFKVREMERDGNKTVRGLSGLRRDSEVLFRPKYETDSLDGIDIGEEGTRRGSGRLFPAEFGGKSGSIMDLPDADVILQEPASLFDRPGFGSVAFRTSAITATFNNLRRESVDEEEEFTPTYAGRMTSSVMGRSTSRTGDETSIGSAGSIAKAHDDDVPWDAEDLHSDEERETTPLQVLLEATGLLDWIPVFNKEQIDLEALMLLSEGDMAKLGLPLGPRKKLLKALHDRKKAIDNPGEFTDSKI